MVNLGLDGELAVESSGSSHLELEWAALLLISRLFSAAEVFAGNFEFSGESVVTLWLNDIEDKFAEVELAGSSLVFTGSG